MVINLRRNRRNIFWNIENNVILDKIVNYYFTKFIEDLN